MERMLTRNGSPEGTTGLRVDRPYRACREWETEIAILIP